MFSSHAPWWKLPIGVLLAATTAAGVRWSVAVARDQQRPAGDGPAAVPSLAAQSRFQAATPLFGAKTAVPLPSGRLARSLERGTTGLLPGGPSPTAPDHVAQLLRWGVTAPQQRRPLVRVDDFGARGDGTTDDTEALQRAADSMTQGGTLVFTAGKVYAKRRVLRVRQPEVSLWGYGSAIYSIVTDAEVAKKGAAEIMVHLAAPHTACYGLTLISNVRARGIGHPHLAGIYISSKSQLVADNRLEHLGILVAEAEDFTVASNVIFRSWADGIHVTERSKHGTVVGNLVRQTGDDLIAVVSYGRGAPNVEDISIIENDVADQYWGRGITVVGGARVRIENNRVSRIPFAAAILVNSEDSWNTSDVHDVLVARNTIEHVHTTKPPFNPLVGTRTVLHGAIDVHGIGNRLVSDVRIVDNRLTDVRHDGVRVRGNVRRLSLNLNRFSSIGGRPVRVEVSADRVIECDGNKTEGAPPSAVTCSR